jgi:restriction system protein
MLVIPGRFLSTGFFYPYVKEFVFYISQRLLFLALPDYQTIMLPLLKIIEDQKEHRMRDVTESLAAHFNLTEDERKTLLPSGTQPTFDNRVGWSKTYLKKAGLLDSPKRAVISITSRGLDVLSKNPAKIDQALLKTFPEFLEFQNLKHEEKEIASPGDPFLGTPEDHLAEAFIKIRSALAQELLEKVLSMTPQFFERLVVELLVQMGYGGSLKDAGKATRLTKDEGIDGVINEDKLGLDIIYIQAKKWKPGNTVGRPDVQSFVGALAGHGAKKGVFITTSSYTKEAREYQPKNDTKIVLIDGDQLAQLMMDYGLGVTTQTVYEVKKLDGDYFEVEG